VEGAAIVEWLLRRHFWIIVLVVLTICATFAALILNAFIGYSLSRAFAVTPKPPAAARYDAKIDIRDFSIANERNLFGARRENIVLSDAEEEEDTGSCEHWADARETAQRVRLIGTAVFSIEQESLALIEDAQNAVRNYSINECPSDGIVMDPIAMEILGVPDAARDYPCNKLGDIGTIQRIEPTRVYFYNKVERRCEYVSSEDESQSTLPPPVVAPSGSAPGKEYGKGVRKVSANAYEIPQNELNEAFENLSEISTQARMVPAFEDGKPIGFRVFSVRPNSVFSKIGLENGDIIMRVNGYDLNSPEKVLEMYPKLKTGQEFTIDMKRGGSPMTLNYSVKP